MTRPLTPIGLTTLAEHKLRPLPRALAHAMVITSPGEQIRMALLNALYRRLTPCEQLDCRAELLECREAMRSNRLASIA